MVDLNIFEYKKISLDTLDDTSPFKEEKNFKAIETLLQEIWDKRKEQWYTIEKAQHIDIEQTEQKFIACTKKHLQAKNYVGVIRYNEHTIHILPKIFTQDNDKEVHVEAMYKHILWWLGYCKKIQFPHYKTDVGKINSDFFEVLMNIFARDTAKILWEFVYQYYIEIEQETNVMKGTLNVSAYICDNIVPGRWHLFNCRYEEFSIDNKFNRIIKYVVKLLYKQTKNEDTKKHFDDILYILDEVSDEPGTAEQCEHIQLSIIYNELVIVLNHCKLFLQHCVSFNDKDELRLFAFLLPMEYIFEDFIYGFLSRECSNSEIKIQGQKGRYLATVKVDEKEKEENIFKIRPDLQVEIKDKKYIIDTKYKLIYPKKKSIKDCISQKDVYQMISYAVGLGINEVKLLYPATIKDIVEDNNHNENSIGPIAIIKIKDTTNRNIEIEVHKINIINRALFSNDTEGRTPKTLEGYFEAFKKKLAENLLTIFGAK